MPRITVSGPTGTPVEFPLGEESLTIGRALTNDLVVNDPYLSWTHAMIRRDGTCWMIEDLGSRNGTRLNGRALEIPAPLKTGDRITIGSTVLVFDEAPGVKARGRASTGVLRITLAGPGAGEEDEVPVLIGRSPAIQSVLGAIDKLAASSQTVLITGESGTGKELAARLLHARSPRASKPFVVLNCPALPGSLLEAELFGVEKGVATGVEPRVGRIESAHGGTLLLDEIGDLDLVAQSKLLRLLQEKSVERIGGRTTIPVDVRFLAATHHDLARDVDRGAFRADLYHRLRVLTLEVPPLRSRCEDIPLLVEHFLQKREGPNVEMSPDAMEVLLRYPFSGNVRELENLVEHVRWQAAGPVIRSADFPEEVLVKAWSAPCPGAGNDLADALFHRIVNGGESFWEVVKAPLKRRELSKDDVRRLVARGHREGGGSYKGMARLFRMEGEHRVLLNFVEKYGVGVRKRG